MQSSSHTNVNKREAREQGDRSISYDNGGGLTADSPESSNLSAKTESVLAYVLGPGARRKLRAREVYLSISGDVADDGQCVVRPAMEVPTS